MVSALINGWLIGMVADRDGPKKTERRHGSFQRSVLNYHHLQSSKLYSFFYRSNIQLLGQLGKLTQRFFDLGKSMGGHQ